MIRNVTCNRIRNWEKNELSCKNPNSGTVIPDPVLHLDANIPDSINGGSPSNNDPIDTWGNLGTGITNATGSGTSRPLYKSSGFGSNNTAYLEFDGADDYLTLGTTYSKLPERTVFSIAEFNGALVQQSVIIENQIGVSKEAGIFQGVRSTNFEVTVGDGTDFSRCQDIGAAGVVTTNTPYLFSDSYTPGDDRPKMYLNGTRLTEDIKSGSGITAIAGDKKELTIGRFGGFSGWFLDGKVAEILVYDTTLTDEQILAIHTELLSKYGI